MRFAVRQLSLLVALLLPLTVFAEDGPDPELRNTLRTAANEAPSFPDRFEAEVWLTDMSQRLARQV